MAFSWNMTWPKLLLDALKISIVSPVDNDEGNKGKLKTNNNKHITDHVAITNGAVNGGMDFIKNLMTSVDKTAAITNADKEAKATSKKHITAIPDSAPLKP